MFRIKRTYPVVFAALLAAAVLPSCHGLAAQATDETPVSAAVVLASAPAPGTSVASITLGLQIKDGRTETRGYSIDATWAHSTEGGFLVVLDASQTRAEFRPAPGADRITVDDNHLLSAAAVRPLSEILAAVAVGSWKRDAPLQLDHRLLAQAGLSLHVHRGRTLLFTAGPMVGVGTQDNANVTDSDGIVNLGGVQSLAWQVSESFGIENTFSAYRDLDNSQDHSLALTLSGTAMISKHLGLKLSYKLTNEGIHPDDVDAGQQEFQVGVTLNLAGG